MHPDTLEFLGRERRGEFEAEAAQHALASRARRNGARRRRDWHPWALLLVLAEALERSGAAIERVARAHTLPKADIR